eukprot:1097285-Amphidinium_carterae.1
MIQSRPEASVTTAFFQGVANKPSGKHLYQAVLLLRWLKRHEYVTTFRRMAGPFRLLLYSDAAFKPEDVEKPHARRGEMLLLTQDRGAEARTIECHILDYSSRKIPRVTRSTYSAELQALVAGIDNAIATSITFEQLLNASWRGSDAQFNAIAQARNLNVPVDVLTDSWSLFQSLASGNCKVPDEKSLILVLSSAREHVKTARVRGVGWCATHEMLADALSKSTIPKDAIVNTCTQGRVHLKSVRWSHL